VERDNTQLDRSIFIPDPDISWAIYSELGAGEVQYYEFDVPAGGLDFFAQLLVPTRPQYKLFRPTMALIGPDLPGLSATDYPFDIPAESGAVILPWQEKEVFFEPFTQTRYYMAQELRRAVPEGKWWLAVYHDEGKEGKYTLAVGEKEEWGLKDIIAFPSMWFNTRWWYSPGQTIALILAGLGIMMTIIWLIYKVVVKFC